MLNGLPLSQTKKKEIKERKKQKTKKKIKKDKKKEIFPHLDSNPGPTDYQSSALPIELSHHI